MLKIQLSRKNSLCWRSPPQNIRTLPTFSEWLAVEKSQVVSKEVEILSSFRSWPGGFPHWPGREMHKLVPKLVSQKWLCLIRHPKIHWFTIISYHVPSWNILKSQFQGKPQYTAFSEIPKWWSRSRDFPSPAKKKYETGGLAGRNHGKTSAKSGQRGFYTTLQRRHVAATTGVAPL